MQTTCCAWPSSAAALEAAGSGKHERLSVAKDGPVKRGNSTMISLRFYLYAGIAALIAFLIWKEHVQTRKLNAARVEVSTLKATLDVERKAREHERAIAKKASDEYQARLDAIDNAPDLGPVRLCPRPRVPPTTQAGTSPGTHESPTGHVQEPDEIDIGPALSDFVEDCEANAAQLESLQGWIRSR
jgi:hypothetical protein